MVLDFIFQTFKITEKLKRKHRLKLKLPRLHIWVSSSIVHKAHQNGAYTMIDEFTLMHHYKVHSLHRDSISLKNFFNWKGTATKSERGRGKEKIFHFLVHTSTDFKGQVWTRLMPESTVPSQTPMLVTETQVFGPSFTAFPGVLIRIWIGHEQQEFEHVPIWDVRVTGGSWTHYVTIPIPKVQAWCHTSYGLGQNNNEMYLPLYSQYPVEQFSWTKNPLCSI